ncbi:MAG: 5-(carboxyamino)imidazole ribonucleotide synthase [Candidatus Eiseniibacteriota bacterium]
MRIGVLGGGQLGRMLGSAGASLGFSFTFLEPAEECPAATTGSWIRAGFDDGNALGELASRSDIITYEFENVPAEAVRTLAARLPVHPSVVSLEAAQDRLNEKTLFQRLEIPTPRFETVEGAAALARAAGRVGLPAVLKTRSMGYDGRGQRTLREPADVAPALAALGERALLLEQHVPFERELSIVGVRGRSGEVAFYPPVENRHREGILRWSLAPAPGLAPALRDRAEGYALLLMEALGHVGVLALELFQTGGELLANEMAPRVHNSGHWTIEGASTSQFENHLRAIAGLPLGATDVPRPCAMVNLIGELPALAPAAAVEGAHVHLYGKQPRPGRKLGHITLCADDAEALRQGLEALWPLLGASTGGFPMASGPKAGGERTGPAKVARAGGEHE